MHALLSGDSFGDTLQCRYKPDPQFRHHAPDDANEVTAEGKKKEALFDKYMCYGQNADETLAKSIADAETKIP